VEPSGKLFGRFHQQVIEQEHAEQDIPLFVVAGKKIGAGRDFKITVEAGIMRP